MLRHICHLVVELLVETAKHLDDGVERGEVASWALSERILSQQLLAGVAPLRVLAAQQSGHFVGVFVDDQLPAVNGCAIALRFAVFARGAAFYRVHRAVKGE